MIAQLNSFLFSTPFFGLTSTEETGFAELGKDFLLSLGHQYPRTAPLNAQCLHVGVP
jgi:hypothetical protein